MYKKRERKMNSRGIVFLEWNLPFVLFDWYFICWTSLVKSAVGFLLLRKFFFFLFLARVVNKEINY